MDVSKASHGRGVLSVIQVKLSTNGLKDGIASTIYTKGFIIVTDTLQIASSRLYCFRSNRSGERSVFSTLSQATRGPKLSYQV